MTIREKPSNKILFVDDEDAVVDIFKLNFSEQYEIYTALSGSEALEVYKKNKDIGVILTDHKMPGMSGVELLSQIYHINPDTIRIIVTAFTEFQNILDAINQGHIFHYVIKPWEPLQLGIILEQGIKSWNLISENARMAEEQKRMNERLQLLTVKLLHAQEDERKRISMELHDDIGQNLIALKLQFSNFCSQLEDEKVVKPQEEVTSIRSALQKTIDSTRNICQNLSPAIIEEFGFDIAIKEFLDTFSRDYNIKTVVNTLPIQKYFSKQELHQIYRILQEIFNNIGKHSGTDRVIMDTILRPEIITIEISDFGCGFDTQGESLNQNEKRTQGLNTINERTIVLGGTLSVESSVNSGSRFILTIPTPYRQN